MRILLIAPRGFCAGVNMALQSLEMAIQRYGPPVYVYHEIVHNRWVVEHFRAQGAIFVDDLEQVPHGSTLLYSAHGVSPEIRQAAAERNLRSVDATCPLVTKVHLEAIRYARDGYAIVLIGHDGHDEVVGTRGEAPHAIRLVQNVADIDRLDIAPDARITYLTQTTLSMDDAATIIHRLRERFPQIIGPPKEDICYATQNRQEAVKGLAGEADLVLVVGSRNSSNSQRLAEIARACGVRSALIDGPADIESRWFSGEETVLITAGASAPEHIVQDCVQWLTARYAATVESRVIRQEQVRFALPKELRTDLEPIPEPPQPRRAAQQD